MTKTEAKEVCRRHRHRRARSGRAGEFRFRLQISVGIRTRDRKGHILDAGFFAGENVDDFRMKSLLSAHLRYIRRSISDQSWASVPPAPALMLTMALFAIVSPRPASAGTPSGRWSPRIFETSQGGPGGLPRRPLPRQGEDRSPAPPDPSSPHATDQPCRAGETVPSEELAFRRPDPRTPAPKSPFRFHRVAFLCPLSQR